MKKSELRALIKEELKGLQELDLSPAVPEDTSYTEFAKAVAQMIKDEYGSHNVEDFMKVLHAELGLSEAKAEGAMSAEEEDMIDDYEEKEANKYALDKEEPLEEGIVDKANAIVRVWSYKKRLTEGRLLEYTLQAGSDFESDNEDPALRVVSIEVNSDNTEQAKVTTADGKTEMFGLGDVDEDGLDYSGMGFGGTATLYYYDDNRPPKRVLILSDTIGGHPDNPSYDEDFQFVDLEYFKP